MVQACTAGLVPKHSSLWAGEAAVNSRFTAVHQGGSLVAFAGTTIIGLAPQREGRASCAHSGRCALALADDNFGPCIEVRLSDLDRVKAPLPSQVAVQLVSGWSRAIGIVAFLAGDAELPMHVSPRQGSQAAAHVDEDARALDQVEPAAVRPPAAERIKLVKTQCCSPREVGYGDGVVISTIFLFSSATCRGAMPPQGGTSRPPCRRLPAIRDSYLG